MYIKYYRSKFWTDYHSIRLITYHTTNMLYLLRAIYPVLPTNAYKGVKEDMSFIFYALATHINIMYMAINFSVFMYYSSRSRGV